MKLRKSGLLLLAALAFACAPPPPEVPTGVVRAPRDAAYLLDPLLGYPLAATSEEAGRLRSAHRRLVETGDAAASRSAARELLERNPELDAASVLLAQAEFVAGDPASAQRRLAAVVKKSPDYLAANVILGRVAEIGGDIPVAYSAYLAASTSTSLAAQRAEALLPRALQIVSNRFRDALQRGRADTAEEHLVLMEHWAPELGDTLIARRELAAAVGDVEGELAVLRRLSGERYQPLERKLLTRRADLELSAGDAGSGLRIYQKLAAADPEDREIADQLQRAQFIWRLGLLPEKVRAAAALPELTRGDMAALLYWLFPEIRYGRVDGARIANDVLDHPHRQEIVRVVNLGIMGVDRQLHRFDPQKPIARGAALATLLRTLGLRQPPLACVSPPRASDYDAGASACAIAVRCGLMAEAGDCLPAAPAAGHVVLDWVRLALEQSAGR